MAKTKAKGLIKEQVKHVASLAKLSLSEKEIKKFQKQLSDIFDYVKALEEVDTTKVEPTSQVTGLENVNRDDKKTQAPLASREALSNASDTHQDYFKIKGIFQE